MKYRLFMALAAACLLVGCSNNDIATDNDEEETPIPIPPKEELVDLTIGVASPTTATRGMGTVGSMDEETNVWKKQTLWMFMTDKGTVKPAQFISSSGQENPYIQLFKNKRMVAPDGAASGLLKSADGAVNYYPMAGNFDFFGYYVDDAAIDFSDNTIDLTDENKQPAVRYVNDSNVEVAPKNASKILTPFLIDGSQDLMAGKATISTEEKALLPDGSDRYYSAYSARRGVIPDVQFNHLLTRLTFSVVAGDKTSAGKPEDGEETAHTKAISVDTIQVQSYAKGTITVAYKTVPQSLLTWDGNAAKKWLDLKEKTADGDLRAMSATDLTWNDSENAGNVIPVGEALLVQPDVNEYFINVKICQWVQTNVNEPEAPIAGTNKPKDYTGDDTVYPGTWSLVYHLFPTSISLSDGSNFKPETSYNVKIYLYGLTKLEMKATLNKWAQGEDITVDKD